MAKNDFSGKPKNKDTYDADWVLRSVPGPNGTSVRAWVTRKQDRQLREDRKQARNARNAATADAGSGVPIPSLTAPTSAALEFEGNVGPHVGGFAHQNPTTTITPTTPTAPGIPGIGPGGGHDVPTGTGTTTTAPGVIPGGPVHDDGSDMPSWWINQVYSGHSLTDEQQFANMANSLMPLLSPEDQRAMASYLATNFADMYGKYAKAKFDPIPTQVGDAQRLNYLNPQRAQQALQLLDKMKRASGAKNMGAGYNFLRNAVSLINQFSNKGGPMTREQYAQFQNALSNLSSNAPKNLGAYANLAQMFNMPNFSAGPLVSNAANAQLFG